MHNKLYANSQVKSKHLYCDSLTELNADTPIMFPLRNLFAIEQPLVQILLLFTVPLQRKVDSLLNTLI